MERVERQIVLDAPADDVWAALTEPRRLSAWIGAQVVALDVRAGGRGTARRADGAERRIRIEDVEPPRRLAFRWWPYELDGHPGPGTRVEFVLDAIGPAQTRLTVTESGLPRFVDATGGEPGVVVEMRA